MDESKQQKLEHRWEAEYCRGSLASTFNHLPGAVWLPNINLAAILRGRGFTDKKEFGKPDAFVCWYGRFICVECKAFAGAVYLGNPADDKDSRGLSVSQRRWHLNVAMPTRMAYYVGVWLYPEREPSRINSKKGRLFLVPMAEYYALEALASQAGTRTVALTADLERVHALKDNNILVEPHWSPFELPYVSRDEWGIPESHPIRREVQS